ncbi:uncharacterized, partial [Tachysurus ichikawai]
VNRMEMFVLLMFLQSLGVTLCRSTACRCSRLCVESQHHWP